MPHRFNTSFCYRFCFNYWIYIWRPCFFVCFVCVALFSCIWYIHISISKLSLLLNSPCSTLNVYMLCKIQMQLARVRHNVCRIVVAVSFFSTFLSLNVINVMRKWNLPLFCAYDISVCKFWRTRAHACSAFLFLFIFYLIFSGWP